MLAIACKVRVLQKLLATVRRQTNLGAKMQRTDDDRLRTFRRVCDEIGEERSYLNKAKILQQFFAEGSDGGGFKGDALLWVQMLIPGASQRVYNLQNKQMLKLFSRLFACDQQEMQRDLEQEGDVSETLRKYFELSKKLKPQAESTLYLQEVDEFLVQLEQKSKEDEQTILLKQLCAQATALDLKTIVRLIKQDLRINAGARHILDGLGPLAYPAFQSSRDLAAVVKQFMGKKKQAALASAPATTKRNSSKAGFVQVMTPISPMLANACKSVDDAFKKSPGGLYSEIKYDGERVQIHKRGDEFKFFSRNLKPVMNHKIKRFHELIPKAFPGGGDMILDSEIILVDTVSGSLLPFGTLGAHKKQEFAHAEVCIFTFDCLLYNGEDLTNVPFHKRRKILEENIRPIKSCVELSESQFLKTKTELSLMTAKVLKANLEGVVLKNPNGTYQPGKRGWLKVKKDYLFGGKMADTADLVVLGAWYGSGKKGGVLSIFLMGCYDPRDGLWKTVTKVHSGLDDSENEHVHEQLMQLMQRADANKTPSWLLCKKALVPDFIANAPKDMPVWEITGAEFTKSEAHTAAGISIRFPRITRLRVDKSAEHANDLPYLQKLYDASKKDVNVDLLLAGCNNNGDGAVEIDEIESKLNVTPTETSKATSKNNETAELEGKLNESPKIFNKLGTATTPSGSGGKLKRRKYADEDDEIFQSNKKKSKTDSGESKTKTLKNQPKLDFSGYKKKPANESEIFKDLIGYFDAGIGNKDWARSFAANGGTVTNNSKEAGVAFYADMTANISLSDVRQNYKNSCRHLSVDWVRDSVETKSCKSYPLYAVVLR